MDLIPDIDVAVRIIRLSLELGLVELSTTVNEHGLVVTVCPTTGAFAAEPLAALSKLAAAIDTGSILEPAVVNA